MPIGPDEFRSVLGRFASGVTILTTTDANGRDHGMTVSAFCSLSLEPPLVLACVDRAAEMLPVLATATNVGMSVLAEDQEHLSRRFAELTEGRFDGVGIVRGRTGVALIADALAHLECHIVQRVEAGDHVIVVARVEAATSHAGRPLLYYRGGYAQLER